MKLEVQHLTVEIDNKKLLDNLSFELNQGNWMMIIGPNGAGKSTLVRALSRALDYTGSIRLNGNDINSFSSKEYAKIIGFQSQMNHIIYDFTVEEVVAMGCYSNGEYNKLDSVLELSDLTEFKNKSVSTLSGGELQRVFLAQLIAQNPQILVLDEPTNNLDIKHQEKLFSLLSEYQKDKEVSVISIVHDLSLAKKYGELFVMSNGKFVEDIDTAYDMDVKAYMKEMAQLWNG